jgi:hypothetical protein
LLLIEPEVGLFALRGDEALSGNPDFLFYGTKDLLNILVRVLIEMSI